MTTVSVPTLLQSGDFWVKIVEMLQHNWALIEPQGDKVTVYFLHDLGGVFDEIPYSSLDRKSVV